LYFQSAFVAGRQVSNAATTQMRFRCKPFSPTSKQLLNDMNNYMKRIVRYGLFQGVWFAVTMTAISYWLSENTLITAMTIGLVGGLLVGIANGLLNYKYAVPKYVLDAVSVDLDSDEQIAFQTPANYTNGHEPISGKLFLTNKRFIFKNHKHDKNIQQFSIDWDEFKKADTFKTLTFFENGLRIHTISGETHNFIVDRLKQWILLAERKSDIRYEFIKHSN
jgi:hypothetical protein